MELLEELSLPTKTFPVYFPPFFMVESSDWRNTGLGINLGKVLNFYSYWV
jgi:hypothetical protein